ncbi:hypothetical protein [Alcaligenes faecalis]|uniref:hypothetical protein n=1 Tax=Alcaligenes faecalis TaxID=511 RepID=UPI0005A81C76|nr:hypothetical protein [Alcaligenes faecalis]ATH99544.1 hypothetical protein CPY64_07290 [Alcaligenes faecalis]AYZ92331.1 hypothetical protein EGY22_13060 [Alcaligenes faecalis]MCX5593067.1 hypothetical protein [Alcaligenes faecalis]QQC31869.1 hypothetical protein I6H81_14625 [Alcaligenes faecalis]CAJ0903315.1 Aldolase_II domain-containing protein [Alcaligenes faecalis subsp. faecalis]
MENFPERFGLDTFYQLFINGWVVDGRAGGLIIGRTHETGHIIMITPNGDPAMFETTGLVAGGEYIMSTQASETHFQRLQEINADQSPCDEEISVSLESRIINTRAEPHDKMLIVLNQFIINAEATKRHFDELEHINSLCPTSNGILFTEEQARFIASINIDDLPRPS